MDIRVKPSLFNYFQASLSQWLAKGKGKARSFLTTEAPPHQLALSFALATLISLAPTPGLNIALTLTVMSLFRQLPRVGIMAGMAVWNIFVITPIYALGYQLGVFLFGDSAVSEIQTINQITSLSKGFFLGNMITAVLIATLCYLILYGFIRLLRKDHSQVHSDSK